MITYKYQIPVRGYIPKDEKGEESIRDEYAKSLEKELNDGFNCLGTYVMFPSESAILDHVSFDIGDQRNVTAINLHTYTQMWEGRERDLKQCVHDCMQYVNEDIANRGMNVHCNEEDILNSTEVKALGPEGEMPKTLYHITDRADLDDILKQGIEPRKGERHLNRDHDNIYLSDKENLASWLSVLKHIKDPVVIEIDAENLESIKPGNMFKDRDYIPGGYGEYYTREAIPASAIKEAEITRNNELGMKITNGLIDQMDLIETKTDLTECSTGLRRAQKMGLMEKIYVDDVIKYLTEHIENDDFGKAVDALGTLESTQMGME